MKASGMITFYIYPYPSISGGPAPFIEGTIGIDVDDFRKRIEDAFSKTDLEIVLAGEGNSTSVNIDIGSEHINPCAKYDLKIPLELECKTVLMEEWKNLIMYHSEIVNKRNDNSISTQDECVQRATKEIWDIMPIDRRPILIRKENNA